MSETVCIDRDRWERVRGDAREMAIRISERGWGEAFAQPGDLDDIPVEADLGVEAMLEGLLAKGHSVEVIATERGVCYVDVSEVHASRAQASTRAHNWRDALRRAYVSVMAEREG